MFSTLVYMFRISLGGSMVKEEMQPRRRAEPAQARAECEREVALDDRLNWTLLG